MLIKRLLSHSTKEPPFCFCHGAINAWDVTVYRNRFFLAVIGLSLDESHPHEYNTK
ncbi:MAG: hypothetical protein HDR27_08740 [Lachnospiraceae bacterium]|nr:hypothetical protein [Lachnospiraceae bacterium]